MITVEKLKLYEYYNGDIDGWSRANQNSQTIGDEDWYLIESLIQDLLIVQNGLASKLFEENLKNRLLENLENDETILNLKYLAGHK